MSDYQAPLGELKFLLGQVVGLPEILARGESGLAAGDIDAVLDEAGRVAGGLLAPLNTVGDRAGSHLDNGVVRTPPGWIDAYRRFAEGGWVGIGADPDHGGQGLPTLVKSAVEEMWQAGNMAFALCPMLSQAGIELLTRYGSADQQARYLQPLITGAWTGSMILTEPQAGTDLAAIRTRAVRDGDGHYRLTGQKIFITYGDHDLTPNIVHMVLARSPDGPPGIKGLSLFIVPKFRVNPDGSLGPRNDVRCVSLEHKLGIHASPTAVMAFGDEGGAHAELVGEENRGIEYMFLMMNNARLSVGLQGIGIAERAYQHALAYARTRVQGKTIAQRDPAPAPILGHPDVHRMLGLAKVRIMAARALALEAAASIDRAHLGLAGAQARADLLIPVVKAWSTDLGIDIASIGVQVHGGMGFIEETGAAQYYRDARIAAIYEGTNGIQANDLLGRKLLRDRGTALGALIQDIRRSAGEALGRPGDDLATISAALGRSLFELERVARWLLDNDADNPRLVAVAATPFLELLGIIAGGWMMARGAIAAQRLQFERPAPGSTPDPVGNETRIIAARVYADHIMPKTQALSEMIVNGGVSLMALDPDWL